MNTTEETKEKGKIKTTLKDFIKLYEKNNNCKILKIEKWGEDTLIEYKRGYLYFLCFYPSNELII